MNSVEFPQAPSKIFLIGLGGIGMSALAQFLVSLGYEVAGSDRDLVTPAQAALFGKLKKQGISAYIQDGSGVKDFEPNALVYSSAIEENNPDFLAAGDTPRFHRSMAMAQTVNLSGLKQIAVAGSCGKTSVTGWLASALNALGQDPIMINGGYTGEFVSDSYPGNFKPGKNYIVYEADESDGSLVNFQPDSALLLNLGLDHYEKDKLDEFFTEYLSRSKQIVISDKLTYLLPEDKPSLTFKEDVNCDEPADYNVDSISHTPEGAHFTSQEQDFKTSQFGNHSVSNALAVTATLLQNGFSLEETAKALLAFKGVARRFDYKGTRGNKRIYDDYAHNIQKISACLTTAQNLSPNPVIGVFQPHGYGPLGFMKDGLKEELQKILRPGDKFIFLPVFYAGGTTSFKPTSSEVAEEYKSEGMNVVDLEDREMLKEFLDSSSEAASVVILGARDPSLSDWSESLSKANS